MESAPYKPLLAVCDHQRITEAGRVKFGTELYLLPTNCTNYHAQDNYSDMFRLLTLVIFREYHNTEEMYGVQACRRR
jgi:hypothetical protein